MSGGSTNHDWYDHLHMPLSDVINFVIRQLSPVTLRAQEIPGPKDCYDIMELASSSKCHPLISFLYDARGIIAISRRLMNFKRSIVGSRICAIIPHFNHYWLRGTSVCSLDSLRNQVDLLGSFGIKQECSLFRKMTGNYRVRVIMI